MRTILCLSCLLFVVELSAQWIAGEAEFIYDFEIKEALEEIPYPGYTESYIKVDLRDTGKDDFIFKISSRNEDNGRVNSSVNVLIPDSTYHICGWSEHLEPPLEPIFFELGEVMLCKDDYECKEDISLNIGYADVNSWSIKPQSDNSYIYFESLTDDLAGWIELSWTVVSLELSETIHRIGINMDLGVSVKSDSVFTNVDETILVKTKIYPNPFFDHIKIELDDQLSEEFRLELYDLAGDLMHNEFYDNQKHILINTETWPNGVYIIKLMSDKRSLVAKVIK